MRRSGPTRHVFVEEPDEQDPVTRMQWCARCHLPASNAVHQLPQRSDEQRSHEARRTGEKQ